MRFSLPAVLVSFLLATACAKHECQLDNPSSCSSPQVCENVQGHDKPLCVPPLQLKGVVYNLASDAGIAESEVSAADPNGAPTGAPAFSGSDGHYTLTVHSDRSNESGAVIGRPVTLRAAASNYEDFPSGIRISLPIDTGAAALTDKGDAYVLETSLTSIGLSALPPAQQGQPSISGKVLWAQGQTSALVAAEASGAPGRTANVAPDGTFTIRNVPPGSYQVSAYGKGANYQPVSVNVQGTQDITGVELNALTSPVATVSGTVQLVAGANGAGTSIVLVLESTFNPTLVRGQAIPGLRAPDPGTSPNITGAFSIAGVPDGKYVVLAAFENDGNVRDPDPAIAGTQIQHLQVSGGAASVSPSFKVTGAITMVSPGAGDSPDTVAGAPTLKWNAYPSSHDYIVDVFDVLGNLIWEPSPVAQGSGQISLLYAGPALSPGSFYQWRVTARNVASKPISMTEDLRGVWQAE